MVAESSRYCDRDRAHLHQRRCVRASRELWSSRSSLLHSQDLQVPLPHPPAVSRTPSEASTRSGSSLFANTSLFPIAKLSAQALTRSHARQDTTEQITCQYARKPRARLRASAMVRRFTSSIHVGSGVRLPAVRTRGRAVTVAFFPVPRARPRGQRRSDPSKLGIVQRRSAATGPSVAKGISGRQ